MPEPRVSVVIPAHNAEATIERTVRSALAQELRDIEVVVAEDASTDATPRILADLSREDPRVRVVQSQSRSAGGARNAALAVTRAAWIQFLDADDRLMPGASRALLTAAQETGAAAGGWTLDGPSGDDLDLVMTPPADSVALARLIDDNPIAMSATLVARRWLDRERFDPAAPAAADYDLWLRLCAHGMVFRTTPDLVAGYRLAPGTNSKRHAEALAFIREIILRASADPAQTARAVESQTLRFATAAALTGDDTGAACDRAIFLLDEHAPGLRAAPARLASRTFEATLHAICARPTADNISRWRARVAAWWDVLEERGTLAPESRAQAAQHLACQCVAPGAIVEHLLRDAQGCTVVIIGHGRNGRRLEHEARARNLPVQIRDDRYDQCGVEVSGGAPMSARLPDDGLPIITPARDGSLVARFQGARRWSAAQFDLAAEVQRFLTPAVVGSSIRAA